MSNRVIRNDKGLNAIYLVKLDDGAFPSSLTADSNCWDLGNLVSSNLKSTPNEEDFKSEDGVVRDTETTITGMTEAKIMSGDEALINFLGWDCKDGDFLQIKKIGIVGSDVHERFEIVKVIPQEDFTAPGLKSSFTYQAKRKVLDASLTITSTNITAIETALGVSIYRSSNTTIPGGVGAKGYVNTYTAIS